MDVNYYVSEIPLIKVDSSCGSHLARYVISHDFDRVTAERDALQQLLNARDEDVDRLRNQLAQCEAMAMMVAEREWAEHVGTGPVSSKVEAAFTQLHNELQEAQGKLAELKEAFNESKEEVVKRGKMLAEAHALLLEVYGGMWPSNPLTIKIGSHLSASAEPSAPPSTITGHVDESCWQSVRVDPIRTMYFPREVPNVCTTQSSDINIWLEDSTFDGVNEDGTPVMVFLHDDHGFVVGLRSITMKGWSCYGPGKDPASRLELLKEVASAAKARRDLSAEIRAAGTPPHADYWHQSIHEADVRLDAALADLELKP